MINRVNRVVFIIVAATDIPQMNSGTG